MISARKKTARKMSAEKKTGMRIAATVAALAAMLMVSGCASGPSPAPVPTSPAGPAASGSGAPPGAARECGIASYYGDHLIGRPTANGETYDPRKATAAHPTLPFGTRLRVRKASGGATSVVRVNDRGPFVDGRIIDVSRVVARELGFIRAGLAEVCIERVAPGG